MSARNGDKARFGKQRKRKMAHRARTQDLLASLKAPVAGAPGEQSPAEHSQAETISAEHSAADTAHHHAGVLGSAAGAIGSVIGSLAAKVTGVKASEAEPAHAE